MLNYTANQKTLITISNLKKAFQHLGGQKMSLINMRLMMMMMLLLSFVGFFRYSELWNSLRYTWNLLVDIYREKENKRLQTRSSGFPKLNSEVCPAKLTNKHFELSKISKTCKNISLEVSLIQKPGRIWKT